MLVWKIIMIVICVNRCRSVVILKTRLDTDVVKFNPGVVKCIKDKYGPKCNRTE
jgi:hypothetical protein